MENKIEFVTEKLRIGWTYDQIGKELGVTRQRVCSFIKERNIDVVSCRNKLTSKIFAMQSEIIETYDELRTVAATANKLGISHLSVKKVLVTNNIEKLTQERITKRHLKADEVVDAYANRKMSVSEIQESLNISKPTIYRILTKEIVAIREKRGRPKKSLDTL